VFLILTPGLRSVSELDYTDNSSTTNDEDYSDEGAWSSNPRVAQDDDQDWVLCDKDCGWCGHCADSVDY
jgi:hypothetical protein